MNERCEVFDGTSYSVAELRAAVFGERLAGLSGLSR